MTGREMIIYILENHLEDKPVLENGVFSGFILASKVATEMNVGLATVHSWIKLGLLDGVTLNYITYVVPNDKYKEFKRVKNVLNGGNND